MKKILSFLWLSIILIIFSACSQVGQCNSPNNTIPSVILDSSNGGIANAESNVSLIPSIVLTAPYH